MISIGKKHLILSHVDMQQRLSYIDHIEKGILIKAD